MVSSIKSVPVVCDDPYATESSSEDEVISSNNTHRPTKPKRYVSKICVGTLMERSNSTLEKVTGNQKSSSGIRGVWRRPCERFAVEIRDPFQKKRKWIGTFDTVEAAAGAYQRRKIDFEEQLGQVNQTGSIKQYAIDVDLTKTCVSSKKKEKEVEDLTKSSNDLLFSPPKTFGFGCDDDDGEEGAIARMMEDPLMTSSISEIFADNDLWVDPMIDDLQLSDVLFDDITMDDLGEADEVDSWFNATTDWDRYESFL